MRKLPAILLALGLICLVVGLDPERQAADTDFEPNSVAWVILLLGGVATSLGGAWLLRRQY